MKYFCLLNDYVYGKYFCMLRVRKLKPLVKLEITYFFFAVFCRLSRLVYGAQEVVSRTGRREWFSDFNRRDGDRRLTGRQTKEQTR